MVRQPQKLGCALEGALIVFNNTSNSHPLSHPSLGLGRVAYIFEIAIQMSFKV